MAGARTRIPPGWYKVSDGWSEQSVRGIIDEFSGCQIYKLPTGLWVRAFTPVGVGVVVLLDYFDMIDPRHERTLNP